MENEVLKVSLMLSLYKLDRTVVYYTSPCGSSVLGKK